MGGSTHYRGQGGLFNNYGECDRMRFPLSAQERSARRAGTARQKRFPKRFGGRFRWHSKNAGFAIAALPQALPQARQRDREPISPVLPCPSDLKTGVVDQASNALVRELITVLGVNRFASHKVKIKFCVIDRYILLTSALQVHLDP